MYAVSHGSNQQIPTIFQIMKNIFFPYHYNQKSHRDTRCDRDDFLEISHNMKDLESVDFQRKTNKKLIKI